MESRGVIDAEAAREGALEFALFCDGAEEGGLVDYARRGRNAARALIAALDELAAERSARVAIQADRDRILAAKFPGAAA